MSILPNSPQLVRPGSAVASSWQEEASAAVRDPGELCRRLGLPASMADAAQGGARQFPVFVPPGFLNRIRPGDPHDPLLRQVLPGLAETITVSGFEKDPVGDTAATLRPGVLQKYAGRALLIATGSCAVHCRYCFRRHFPYQEVLHSDAAWDSALMALADDPSITEVILSGGDPLMLVDQSLGALVEKIVAIKSITRLRVHTRVPVMIPARVTDELLRLLTESRLQSIVVLHANHAQELDDSVAQAIARLRGAGLIVLNQAVLLRGVNDSVAAQVALSERLIEAGVLPYYLHQLDRVDGAAHFEVPMSTGKEILAGMQAQLPGYLVPKYVQEIPGETSKTSIPSADALEQKGPVPNSTRIRDRTL
ncbi:MAG: EF-P beta-lysylation protein EpmB [Pirellulales bacterium]|nr:EF-P beta-lysylation protein EpmB [Pirellulales bacterium]